MFMLLGSELKRHAKKVPMTSVPFADKLPNVHPLFELPDSKVLLCERATSRHKHWLIISNFAVLVARKRTFPSVFSCKTMIPYHLLTSLTTSKGELKIEGNGKKIAVVAGIKDVMNLCCFIRRRLFGDKDFNVSDDVKSALDPKDSRIDIGSELIARFFSLCSVSKLNSQLVQHVENHVKILKSCNGCLTVSPDLVASPLMKEILLAVSRERTVTRIALDRVNIAGFGEMLTESLLNIGEHIEELDFTELSFAGAYDDFGRLFGRYTKAPLRRLVFKTCDLTSRGFELFLTDLSEYKKKIDCLSFKLCKMDTEKVLKGIVNAASLHCLRQLVISESPVSVDLVGKLYDCDWMKDVRSLEEVKLENVCVEVGDLLAKMFRVDTGLGVLALTGNKFVKEMTPIDTFFSLRVLNLSKSTFTASALVSLFTALQKATARPETIALDCLCMSQDEFKKFYEHMPSFKLPDVRVFSWIGNEVPIEMTGLFLQFLRNQPKLRDLSISHVVNASADVISSLVGCFQALKLVRLVMRGRGATTFGPQFTEILKVFVEVGTLQSLDIIGQKIGDEGFEVLSRLLEIGLVELSFDGTCVSKLATLINLLQRMVESKTVEFATWPAIDVKTLMSKVNASFKLKTTQEVEELKAKFSDKFHLKEDTKPIVRSMSSSRMRDVRRLRGTSTVPARSPYNIDSLTEPRELTPEEILSSKDGDVSRLLVECLGIDSLKHEKDALVQALRRIRAQR